MNQFYDVLKQIVSDHHLNFGEGDSVFTTLYEVYSECKLHRDHERADFLSGVRIEVTLAKW